MVAKLMYDNTLQFGSWSSENFKSMSQINDRQTTNGFFIKAAASFPMSWLDSSYFVLEHPNSDYIRNQSEHMRKKALRKK